MSNPFVLIGLVGGIIAASLLGSYFLTRTGWPMSQWAPIGLSVASLLIAVLSAFKADLFDFSLNVVGGDIALMHSTEPNATHSGVLIPLHFANRGYGEGIVLEITADLQFHRDRSYQKRLRLAG